MTERNYKNKVEANRSKTKFRPLLQRSHTENGIPYGEGSIHRYFIAVSPWSWGHFLQVHDNMIHHWEPGYCVEVPNEAFHLSGNCGISPKYTLTITGFVND